MPFSALNPFTFSPAAVSRLVFIATLVASSVPAVQAKEYYKWVDEKGVSHFSEKPVPGKNAVKIGGATKTEAPAASETSPADTTAANKETTDTNTSSASAKANNSLNDATASNDALCQSARSRLTSLQSGQRIKLVGEDGKAVYLEAKQIQEEIAKTQALIKASCI